MAAHETECAILIFVSRGTYISRYGYISFETDSVTTKAAITCRAETGHLLTTISYCNG